MRKFLYSLCACLSLVLLSSCGSDDDGNYATKTFPGCFAYVNDMPNDVPAIYSGVTYQLSIFYGDNKAQIQISGLQLSDGTKFPTMTLKDLRWKMDKYGWYEIEATNVKPSLANYGKVPTFTTLKFRYCDRYVDGVSSPGFAAYFVLDSNFSVTSGYPRQTLFGTTTSTEVNTGSEYTTDLTDYYLYFNMETRRLEITMKNAKFMDRMPLGFDIVMKNIPFTISGTTARWDVDALTPEIGGTPYPAYPITDLAGEYDFGNGLDMTFTCEPRQLGTFKVEVECDYAFEK